MTYCVGILLREGLIMMSDTRTNAGIDNISVYRKMHVLADSADDRLIVCMSAGNLSVTQSVLGLLGGGARRRSDPTNCPRTVAADADDVPNVAQLDRARR